MGCNIELTSITYAIKARDLLRKEKMHVIVEKVLMELVPKVGECYRQYRNYKQDFVKMLDEVYIKEQEQRYVGDVIS